MQSFICTLSLSLLPFGRPSAFYSNLINLLIYPVIILISGRAKTFVRPHCPSVGLFVCLFLYSTFILSVLRRSPPRALQTTVLCAPNRLSTAQATGRSGEQQLPSARSHSDSPCQSQYMASVGVTRSNANWK